MSHNSNKLLIYKNLEKILLEKPKLLRSESQIKQALDAVKNNYFIHNNVTIPKTIQKNAYQLLQMYSRK
jgi:hypothetical protein